MTAMFALLLVGCAHTQELSIYKVDELGMTFSSWTERHPDGGGCSPIESYKGCGDTTVTGYGDIPLTYTQYHFFKEKLVGILGMFTDSVLNPETKFIANAKKVYGEPDREADGLVVWVSADDRYTLTVAEYAFALFDIPSWELAQKALLKSKAHSGEAVDSTIGEFFAEIAAPRQEHGAAGAKESDATLSETMEFVKKMVRQGRGTLRQGRVDPIREFHYDGCYLSITADLGPDETFVSTTHLEDVTALATVSNDTGVFVQIVGRVENSVGIQRPVTNQTVRMLVIGFDTLNRAQRVENALTRAVALCQGEDRDDPF